MSPAYPHTPDGRYFVAKGRLWRCSNPALAPAERQQLVKALMAARRAVGAAQTEAAERQARERVQEAKVALGERGPVWWSAGAADESRKSPANSGYAEWWAALDKEARAKGRS